MKSDKSRDTFHPEKHFSSVRLQQGRVLTDADWNEQSDVIEHRNETTSLDVIGPAGVPIASNGFQIDPFTDSDPVFPVNFRINGGRMYVDGILCELDHEFVNYTTQDDKFFDPTMAATLAPTLPTPGDLSQLPLPELSPSGMVLVYADVWMRHVGVVEDPTIRETALGGPDTATRAETICQIKVLNFPDADPPLSNIDQIIADLNAGPVGMMEAQVEHPADTNQPCIIPESAGFTRLENQLYRVEVHTPGEFVLDDNDVLVAKDGIFPTFKWSRDNGSILAEWLADPQPEVGTLKIRLPTRDETRGFAVGEWVELTDDTRELSGVGGIFVQLVAPTDQTQLSYDPSTINDPLGVVLAGGLPVRVPDAFHPKVRRWDMPPTSGGPQIIDPTTGAFVDLEDGVQIRFANQPGKYRVGDYWLIPARTINNTIEFPAGPQPPLGVRHHFTCLASFQVTSFENTLVDCRKLFNPLTDLQPGVQDQPTPGQYRYYLIDGDSENNAGGDANGRVGIDDNPATALSKAVPFLTVGKALSVFPRDGNDSHAIFLLRSGFTYGDFLVSGVHGYRKVVIRGSSFQNINTFDEQLESGASSQTLPCAIQNGSLPLNLIGIDRATALPAPPESPHVGQRVRFPSTTPTGSLGNFASMLLGIEATVNHTIAIADVLNERPSSSDTVLLERPNVFFNLMMLGIEGQVYRLGDNAYPSLSLVGLNVQQLECDGGIFGEIAFCQVSRIKLSSFDQFSILGDFHDETGSFVRMGAGLIASTLFIDHGSFLELKNSAALGGQAVAVDDLHIGAGFFSALTLTQCDQFQMGQGRSGGEPRLLRLGAEQTGIAIQLNDSSGSIFSAEIDSPVPLSGSSELPFDFTVVNACITLNGTNRSLKLDDLQVFEPLDAGARRSGVILDASGAVACTVNYDPTIVASGIIVLPQTSNFRPLELSVTDVIDSASNHFLSPTVSFTHKGIPWKKAFGSSYQRYSVSAFVEDQDFRVQKTQAFSGMTAARIAGVAQQEYLPNTDGVSMHVTTGYSLVRLSSTVPATLSGPVPALLSDSPNDDFGVVRLATENTTSPQIQIGILVRVITYQDNHPETLPSSSGGYGGPIRLGLVRLDIRDLPPVAT